MSKVNIDTDVISRTILPLAKNEISRLNATISTANHVSFPNGEYNWSGIIGELDDCKEEANKYANWIEDLAERFTNNMNDRIDEIKSIEVNDIQVKSNKVK